MRSSITASDRSKHAKNTQIKPLSGEFFDNLIKLETDIVQKKYTAESLDELMQCYGQAVEYYDSIKDQISAYFIFKIQDILMTKKAMKVLMNESAKVAAAAITLNAVSIDLNELKDTSMLDQNESNPHNSSQIIDQAPVSPNKSRVTFANDIPTSHVIMETVGDESSDDEDEEEKEVMMAEKQRRITGMNKKRGLVKSLQSMKNQKQKMFNLQLKLQSARAHDKQNLHEVLSSFGNFSEDNDRVVTRDIEIQKIKIRTKLAKKRKDGFMNFTQSSHGFAQVRDLIENMTIESVLKGLDDEDSAQSNEQETYGNESEIEAMQTEMKKQTVVMCNE